jgi:hypothetical protein
MAVQFSGRATCVKAPHMPPPPPPPPLLLLLLLLLRSGTRSCFATKH